MANAKLDTLDYKILKMLSIDARKPYLEVARVAPLFISVFRNYIAWVW